MIFVGPGVEVLGREHYVLDAVEDYGAGAAHYVEESLHAQDALPPRVQRHREPDPESRPIHRPVKGERRRACPGDIFPRAGLVPCPEGKAARRVHRREELPVPISPRGASKISAEGFTARSLAARARTVSPSATSIFARMTAGDREPRSPTSSELPLPPLKTYFEPLQSLTRRP